MRIDTKWFFIDCLLVAVFIVGAFEIAARLKAMGRDVADSPSPATDKIVTFP